MPFPDGYRLIALDRIDSTNAEALRRAQTGAAHATVFTAAEQTAGRGRRGRSWLSETGNLFMTILVRPPADVPWGQLSFLTAVSCAEAIGASHEIRLKWPNDLLIEGRKIAGILIEADHGAAAVGIGVNTHAVPEALADQAAHLSGMVSADVLAVEICARFEAWYRRWLSHGFDPVREAWLERAWGLGEAVAAHSAAGVVSGRFERLTSDGALIVVDEAGAETAISAGEVFFGSPACC